MRDIFYEQIIPITLNVKQKIARWLAIILPILLLYLLMAMLGVFGITIGILVLYLDFVFLLPKFRMEYEYSLVNKELSIAKIYNKASRKDLLTLDLTEAEIIAPSNSPRLDHYRHVVSTTYTSQEKGYETYSILIKQGTRLVNIVIEPDERMIQALCEQLPSHTYKN